MCDDELKAAADESENEDEHEFEEQKEDEDIDGDVQEEAAAATTFSATAWMQHPVIVPASDGCPLEQLNGGVDVRIIKVLSNMGIERLFSVQKALLDAFLVRAGEILLSLF